MTRAPKLPRHPLARSITILATVVIVTSIFAANWVANKLASRPHTGTAEVRAVSDAYLQQVRQGLLPVPKSGLDTIVVTSTTGTTFHVQVQTDAGYLYYSTKKKSSDIGEPVTWTFRAIMPPDVPSPLSASESPTPDGEESE